MPLRIAALRDKYPNDAAFLLLADSLAVVARKFPHTVLAQNGEDIIVLNGENEAVSISAHFCDQFGTEICTIAENKYELNLPEGYQYVASAHQLTITGDDSRTSMKIEFLNSRVFRISGSFFLRQGEPFGVTEAVVFAERSMGGFEVDVPSPTFRLTGSDLTSGGDGNANVVTLPDYEELQRTGVLGVRYTKLFAPGKGVLATSVRQEVNAGSYYLAAPCRQCGKLIYAFDDPSNGQFRIPFTGEAQFLLMCPRCNDIALYPMVDFVPVKSKETLRFEKTFYDPNDVPSEILEYMEKQKEEAEQESRPERRPPNQPAPPGE